MNKYFYGARPGKTSSDYVPVVYHYNEILDRDVIDYLGAVEYPTLEDATDIARQFAEDNHIDAELE